MAVDYLKASICKEKKAFSSRNTTIKIRPKSDICIMYDHKKLSDHLENFTNSVDPKKPTRIVVLGNHGVGKTGRFKCFDTYLTVSHIGLHVQENWVVISFFNIDKSKNTLFLNFFLTKVFLLYRIITKKVICGFLSFFML
jgi:hypothetical protein